MMQAIKLIDQALEELETQAGVGDRHDLVISAAAKVLVLGLMAVGEQLGRMNDSLDSVIGQTASGSTKWIETYDNRPSGEI